MFLFHDSNKNKTKKRKGKTVKIAENSYSWSIEECRKSEGDEQALSVVLFNS